MNAFARWLQERYFLLCLLSVLLLAGSLWATWTIRLEVTPSENAPSFLFVSARSAMDGSPLQLESLVTTAVEGAARSVPGIIAYSTRTGGRGISLSLTFRPGTDLDLATVQVQESLQNLAAQGLLDPRGISVGRFNPDATPLLRLAITEPTGLSDLTQLIQNEARPRIESLGEVSKVEFTGADGEQLQLRLPLARVLAQGIEPEAMSSRLRLESFRDSVGTLRPEALGDAHRPGMAIRSRLEVSTLGEFTGQVLSSKSAMRIKDLGEIVPVALVERPSSRTDGKESAFAEIFLRDRGNPFELKRQVDDAIHALPRLHFSWVMDRVDDLANALADVASSLFQSVAITFAVIFVFLRNWRRTTLISITIPLTLLLTIAILRAAGLTLNIMTLSGLILGIGMVVDNVILVIDRTVELRADGTDLWPAIARSCAQSAPALAMATLTNAIIFLPVSFTDSDDSFMSLLRAFQAPILATLGASIVLSLLVLPAITRPFPRATEPTIGEGESEAVTRVFRWIYDRKGLAAALVILALVFIAERVGAIPQVDLDPPTDPWATLELRFFKDLPDAEHRGLFDLVEKQVLEARTTLDFGTLSASFTPRTGSAQYLLYPVEGRNPDEEIPQLEARLKKWVAAQQPMLSARISVGYDGSGSVQEGVARRTFTFEGSRMSVLLATLEGLRSRLQAVPGVHRVLDEREAYGKEALVFIPSPNLLSKAGIGLNEIATRISSSNRSASVGPFQQDGKTVALQISLLPVDGRRSWTLDDVLSLPIRNKNGTSFTLAALGKVVRQSQLGSLSRNQGRTKARLVVEFKDPAGSPAMNKAASVVGSKVRGWDFPAGYGVQTSAAGQNVDQMQKQMLFLIALSSVLIYLVLGAAFQSLLLPIAVLATIPAAVLCGIFGLWALSRDLDVMARLSLVILVGIGVNNAIILIDLIQELRSNGMSRKEAVIRACSLRFRAVLMTTTIQVLGVVPVAIGNSKIMGIPYASLGITIISGMLLSTVVTLAMIPWLYDVFSRIEDRFSDANAAGATQRQPEEDPFPTQSSSSLRGQTST